MKTQMTDLPAVVVALVTPLPLAAQPVPHPEHPRPDFRREPWVNLNGSWLFEFDPKDAGENERWFERGRHEFTRKIVVPFPWESRLSGIGETQYQGVAWYAREVEIPAGPGWDGKDAWLVIGACDWEAKIWVNGRPAGEHVGGYMPFAVNLSAHAKPGEKAFVVVRARDVTDPQQPTGKQINWYTRTSGIWQTVYVEPRARAHVAGLRFACAPAGGGARTWDISYEVRMSEPAAGVESELYADGRPAGRGRGDRIAARIEEAKPWSPDSPHLYDARIVLRQDGRAIDEVHTYFGLRTVETRKAPGRDYRYIYLNGQPIYLAGALHQSFHPEGIYQYPDDAAIRADYEFCKRAGLNFLRIHIKNAIPRELYWADKLGVLIMQDMPNFWKKSPRAQEWFEQMLRAAIDRDFNHPALFAWCDFNETWGIGDGGYTPETHRWVAGIWRLTKELDPSRLAEDNSPCNYDHVVTDINSWHFYINEYEAARRHIQEVVDKTYPGSGFNYVAGHKQEDEPLMNSEYGGISAGLGDQDISWCFKYLTNELRRHDKICGYVYTELSDIEWEHNGFLNYDRSEKEFGYEFWHPGFSLRDLNSPDFVVIDAPPMLELKPGREVRVPVRISHWSYRQARDLKLRWCVRWVKPGRDAAPTSWHTRPARWKPFEVVEQDPIAIPAEPPSGPAGALLVELMDGDEVLARNYVNLTASDERFQPGTRLSGNELVLAFWPGEFSQRTFEKAAPPTAAGQIAWAAGEGAGYYEYALQVPEGLNAELVERLCVRGEFASRAGDAKLDWPARRTPHDRPQTDGRKWPADLRITVNGVEMECEPKTIPDDPADARGALSHHRGLKGGYGYWVQATAAGERLRAILNELGSKRLLRVRFEVPAEAEHKGGLTIYGAGVGCYGLPPAVVLVLREGHGLSAAVMRSESPAVNRAGERVRTAIETAETGGHEWRFTTDPPGADWTSPDFDDTAWKKGRGGFGARGTPNALIGTPWRQPEIWLRTAITIDDPGPIAGGVWRIHHDEDVEIYLNGKRVLTRSGFVTQYVEIPLEADALAALRKGRNVVAVHCRQTGGGQNIDVGLRLARKE